jgi:histidine triad (HIT) family protein
MSIHHTRRELLAAGAAALGLAATSDRAETAGHEPGCVFCGIARGAEERTEVYRDAMVVAFATIEPREPGHLLLAPIAHVRDLYSLDETTAAHLFVIATRLAPVIKRVFKADGLTLIQNNEAAGGQTVFHFHLHLVPRYAGRPLFQPMRVPQRASRAALERRFAPLRAALAVRR